MNAATTVASFSRFQFKHETSHRSSAASRPPPSPSTAAAHASSLNLKHVRVGSRRPILLCCSSSRPGGGSSSGESESRSVLDAFFLGKAVAEALNERIESTIGEFLSTIGRLQAEQQKQVQDFQEEVFERAKRAKEKAARESMESQGLLRKSTAADTTPVSNGSAADSQTASSTITSSNSYSGSNPPDDAPAGSLEDPDSKSEDPAIDVSTED